MDLVIVGKNFPFVAFQINRTYLKLDFEMEHSFQSSYRSFVVPSYHVLICQYFQGFSGAYLNKQR